MIILPSMKGIISKPIISFIEGMIVAMPDANIIYKLDTTGAISPTFTSGFVTSNVYDSYVFYFNSLLVLANKKIIAAGQGDSSYFGTGYYGYRSLERLNSDGSLDLSFNSNLIGPRFMGTTGLVQRIAIDSNNNIVGVGIFDSYDDDYLFNAPGIFRVDSTGAFDSSFSSSVVALGIDFSSCSPSCLAIQSDNKILIGTYDPFSPIKSIYRLNSDGSEDTTFNTNLGNGFNGSVNGIAILPNGKIVCVGNFDISGAYGIAVLNSDGTLDTSFNFGSGFDSNVYGVKIETGIDSYPTLLVYGSFLTYQGSFAQRLVRIFTNPSYAGAKDISFHTENGFNAPVTGLDLQSDGQIVCIGEFTSFGGISKPYIARLKNPTSIELDTSYSPSEIIFYLPPINIKRH